MQSQERPPFESPGQTKPLALQNTNEIKGYKPTLPYPLHTREYKNRIAMAKVGLALILGAGLIIAPHVYLNLVGEPGDSLRDTTNMTMTALAAEPTWPVGTFIPDSSEQMIASVTAHAMTQTAPQVATLQPLEVEEMIP